MSTIEILSSKEIEEKYGLPATELDSLARDVENDILHGEVRKTVVGRPLMYGEKMQQVGFKEPIRMVAVIDARAHELGLKRSEYLRCLVERDLEAAGLLTSSAPGARNISEKLS